MPIDPNEECWIFVSFLTLTSTGWQWLTDVPAQGNGCPRLLAVPGLASLLRQARPRLIPMLIRIRNVCAAERCWHVICSMGCDVRALHGSWVGGRSEGSHRWPGPPHESYHAATS